MSNLPGLGDDVRATTDTFGTSWINDPGRDLVAIVMTQSSDFLFSGALEEFWRGVYEAIG